MEPAATGLTAGRREPVSRASFYRELRPFHRFVEEAFEPDRYRAVPSDWWLMVADITGSTRAVQGGRYAEVNYLGAACIVAVNNALDGLEVPTVFGGDGATFAVPPQAREAGIAALVACRGWGKRAFGLDLRVGVVEVAEIERRGASLSVAKLEFSPGNAMAMFRGDGFDLADELVKNDDGGGGFLIADDPAAPAQPDLSDLSCRWTPMPSEHGVMLCMILAARESSVAAADAIYRQALERIDAVVGLNRPASSPVKLDKLRVKLSLASIAREVRSRGAVGVAGVAGWLRVSVLHLAQVLTFAFGLRPGGFDPELYKKEITVNSDFRKVSGKLRLIVDCSVEQADRIEGALGAMHAGGQLDFGTHRAGHAIMTCVTPNVDNHEHVHYIDGSEGGLWSAANALKSRMRGHGA